MPEGVGMVVWQIICCAELVQPIGNAVRVHDRAVILCEKKTGVLPNVRMEEFCAQLLGSILFEKSHGFRRKADHARTAGFGRTYINTLILGVQKCLLDHHDALVQINTVPLQTHQLTSAAAGVDENVGHDLPLERRRFQRFEDLCHLFRLEVRVIS